MPDSQSRETWFRILFATVSKFGHFHSLHDAPVHSAVYLFACHVPGKCVALEEWPAVGVSRGILALALVWRGQSNCLLVLSL